MDIRIFEFRMSDASDSGSSLNSGDESLSDNDQDQLFILLYYHFLYNNFNINHFNYGGI